MDYRKPTTNPLQDVGGNETADFTGFEVDNNSTVDGTPPEPASAEVPEAGSSLTLTFNEDLDRTAAVPPPGAFTVKADGDTVTVQSVALGTDPDQLVFDLGTGAIKQGRTVTVDYAVPATNPIRDAAGNEAAAFTGFEVDNNSTVDGIPPVPASAEVLAAGDNLTRSPSTRTSTSGRASSPRPAPSPSRPTASRWRCNPCWPPLLTRWF